MPLLNSTSGKDPVAEKNSGIYLKDPVDLNEALRNALQKIHSSLQKIDVSIRCESLPVISGNKDHISRLFDNLVSMIVSRRPVASKLFLYIDCEEEKDRVTEGTLIREVKNYSIKFHTNISSKSWKNLNQQVLSECGRILSEHHAGFVINNNDNTGCVFTISLPGKFQ
jgi:hypothetical protein